MCCECINLRRSSRGGVLPSGKGNNSGGSHSSRAGMRWEIENVDCRDSESLSEAGRGQEPETCFRIYPLQVEPGKMSELRLQTSAASSELSAAAAKVNAAGIHGIVRDNFVVDTSSLVAIFRARRSADQK